jgi:hypothetical protein
MTLFEHDLIAAPCRGCVVAHARRRMQQSRQIVSTKLYAISATVAYAPHSQQAVLDQRCAHNYSAACRLN